MYILCTSEGLSKFNEIIVSHKKEKSNKIKKNNSPKARVSQTRLNFRAKINSTKLTFLAQKFKLSRSRGSGDFHADIRTDKLRLRIYYI